MLPRACWFGFASAQRQLGRADSRTLVPDRIKVGNLAVQFWNDALSTSYSVRNGPAASYHDVEHVVICPDMSTLALCRKVGETR